MRITRLDVRAIVELAAEGLRLGSVCYDGYMGRLRSIRVL